MTQSRLQLIAPDLWKQLLSASKPQLRRIAAAVSRTIVERVGLSDQAIVQALSHLSESKACPPELLACLHAFVDKLDAEYFELKQPYEDREDAGKSEPKVAEAFSKARAASSVAFSLHEIELIAASEAIYEATVAVDDATEIASIVNDCLNKP